MVWRIVNKFAFVFSIRNLLLNLSDMVSRILIISLHPKLILPYFSYYIVGHQRPVVLNVVEL